MRQDQLLKIVSAVSFEKVGVLACRLHSVVFCAVILCFDDFSDHAVRRNIEDTVEMQSFRFSAAFPYADMLPAFAVYKVFECVPERLAERFFRMFLTVISKSAKEIPSL